MSVSGLAGHATPLQKSDQNGKKAKKRRRAYGTPDSHVVPHRSTDRACSGLTAQFGRDTVRFTEYGRRRVQKQYRRYMKQLLPVLPVREVS